MAATISFLDAKNKKNSLDDILDMTTDRVSKADQEIDIITMHLFLSHNNNGWLKEQYKGDDYEVEFARYKGQSKNKVKNSGSPGLKKQIRTIWELPDESILKYFENYALMKLGPTEAFAVHTLMIQSPVFCDRLATQISQNEDKYKFHLNLKEYKSIEKTYSSDVKVFKLPGCD